jgi:hypothetical protein
MFQCWKILMSGAWAATNEFAFAIEGEIEMTWKHTKPGSMNECTVTDERGRFVGQVEGIYGPLMASAPELLEFIEKMRSYFQSFVDDAVRPDEWIMQEWVRKCDAVIAKAEGKC